MWIHYANSEAKTPFKRWKRAGFSPPKKLNLSPSAGKGLHVASQLA